jgi:hypothetical protein
VTRRIALVLFGATLAAAPLARAQGEPAGEGQSAEQSRREARHEALRVVDAYVMSNLQPSLGLTDAEYVKVLPLVQKLQASRREYLLGRMRLIRQLRRQLRSGAAGEADVQKTLHELKRVETSGVERTRADAAELDRVLSPLQQAKFRVLELEVEQRLRDLMSRARQRSTPERPPRE